MSKINGTLYLFKVDGTAVGATKTSDISFDQAMINITTKDSGGYEENLGGLKSCNGNFDGLLDPTNAVTADDLLTLLKGGTSFDFVFETAAAGNDGFSGTCFLTNLSFSFPMEDAVTIKGSFRGTGTFSTFTTT